MKLKDKDYEIIIQELKELSGSIGINLRFEKGDFKGGYCLLKNNKVIVINKTLMPQKKVNIVIKALKEINIDDIYLNPRLRELIEEIG